MPSDKRNSIKAMATGLIFHSLRLDRCLFGIPQYTQCIPHELTSVPFIFAGSEKYRFGGST